MEIRETTHITYGSVNLIKVDFSDNLITKHPDGPGTPHFSGINPLDFFLPGYANDNFSQR